MDKGLRNRLPLLVILILGAAIAILLFYIIPRRYGLNREISFEESDRIFDNPLEGFAPPAQNEEQCEEAQLVYIGLTWAEWEPREGVYACEELEEKFHVARWKKEHKHAVLRFVCDMPSEEPHRDIPDWLFRKTKDGSDYSTDYGMGYAPNYENSVFRKAHDAAVLALAKYCNDSGFVMYVELGSLGHWGEWHVHPDVSPGMPDAEICREYVMNYADHFKNAKLLMRRNYSVAVENGLGLYNDMTGERQDTEEWLDWIKNGGSYDTEGSPLEFVPLEKFWECAPVGGEMTPGYPMDELLGRRLPDTLEMIEKSHMTFIGPNAPVGDQRKSEGAREILRRIGYRIYISELETQYSFGEQGIHVLLTWENTGLAPFYWNWPVTMHIYDSEGELRYTEPVDVNLTELLPDGQIVTQSSFPLTDVLRQGFQIGISISDPTAESHVRLAMDVPERDGVQIIYKYGGD